MVTFRPIVAGLGAVVGVGQLGPFPEGAARMAGHRTPFGFRIVATFVAAAGRPFLVPACAAVATIFLERIFSDCE